MFPLAKAYVDRVILVDDDDIVIAQEKLWSIVRVVAQPGGAATLAALLSGKYQIQPKERVGVLISGGNTVAVDFAR